MVHPPQVLEDSSLCMVPTCTFGYDYRSPSFVCISKHVLLQFKKQKEAAQIY